MHINIQQIAFIPVVFQSTGQDDYFIFECSAIVNILEKNQGCCIHDNRTLSLMLKRYPAYHNLWRNS